MHRGDLVRAFSSSKIKQTLPNLLVILYDKIKAGPIDNLIRKTDRNGALICLVTYKHIESCEYAIQLFNGLQLFGQSIRVQFSQNSQNMTLKSSMSFNSPNTPNGGMKQRTASSTPALDRALPSLPPPMGQFDPTDPNVQQMMMPFVNQLGALLTNPAASQPQDQYNRSRSSHGGRAEHHSRRGEYYDNRGAAGGNQYNKTHHQGHSSWQPPVSRDVNFNNNQRHSRHQTFNQPPPNRFNNNQMVQNNFNNFNPNFNNNARQRSRSRSPSNKRHKRF